MKMGKKEKIINDIVTHILAITENNNSEILAVRLAPYRTKWLEEIESTLCCLANEPIEDD